MFVSSSSSPSSSSASSSPINGGGGGGGGAGGSTAAPTTRATSTSILSTTTSTAGSIQKAKNRRTVLPKTSLIQLYLNNGASINDTIATTTTTTTAASSSHRTRLLPKFNQQDIIDKLKDVTTTQPVRKIVREALNNTNSNASSTVSRRSLSSAGGGGVAKNGSTATTMAGTDIANGLAATNTMTNTDGNCVGGGNSEDTVVVTSRMADLAAAATAAAVSSRENLIRHLTREFLLDCKQKLDSESFRACLSILAEANKSSAANHLLNMIERDKEHKRVLDQVYAIIRTHHALTHKFAAFITPEHALRYDLFAESLHYERCYEFMSKLEQTLPGNKCALKKLLQMMANASSAIAEEGAIKMSVKLDEIRAKLKTVTRNNQTLMHEFERLFDRRLAVDEPVLELISLVDAEAPTPVTVNGRVVEIVDLTDPFALTASSSATNIATGSGRTRASRVLKSAASAATTPTTGLSFGVTVSGVVGGAGLGGGIQIGNGNGGAATGGLGVSPSLSVVGNFSVHNRRESRASSAKKT